MISTVRDTKIVKISTVKNIAKRFMMKRIMQKVVNRLYKNMAKNSSNKLTFAMVKVMLKELAHLKLTKSTKLEARPM